MDWTPLNLAVCTDSGPLAQAITILSVGVMVNFTVIARSWYLMAKRASPVARRLQLLLMGLFVASAVSGYGSRAVNAWYPKAGFIIMLVGLVVLNALCFVFHYAQRRYRFSEFGAYEALGVAAREASIKDIPNTDLGATVKELIELLDSKTMKKRTQKHDRVEGVV